MRHTFSFEHMQKNLELVDPHFEDWNIGQYEEPVNEPIGGPVLTIGRLSDGERAEFSYEWPGSGFELNSYSEVDLDWERKAATYDLDSGLSQFIPIIGHIAAFEHTHYPDHRLIKVAVRATQKYTLPGSEQPDNSEPISIKRTLKSRNYNDAGWGNRYLVADYPAAQFFPGILLDRTGTTHPETTIITPPYRSEEEPMLLEPGTITFANARTFCDYTPPTQEGAWTSLQVEYWHCQRPTIMKSSTCAI